MQPQSSRESFKVETEKSLGVKSWKFPDVHEYGETYKKILQIIFNKWTFIFYDEILDPRNKNKAYTNSYSYETIVVKEFHCLSFHGNDDATREQQLRRTRYKMARKIAPVENIQKNRSTIQTEQIQATNKFRDSPFVLNTEMV